MGALEASWGLSGASWWPLGELLCAFVIQERVQDARCCIIYHVQKKCLFLEREHEIQQPQASWRLLVCLLGRLGSLLEAFGTFLEHLRSILTLSWRPCWSLGRPKGENVDFSLVLQGSGSPATPARPPARKRAGAVEGLRGRHKSLPLEA